MLASRSIGTRWLGSGRVQRRDYIEISATLSFVGSFDSSTAARKSLAASLATSAGLTSQVDRRKGVSAGLNAGGGLSASVGRRRRISATLTAVGGLDGASARQRPVSANLATSGALSAEFSRLRNIGAQLKGLSDVEASIIRGRNLSANLATSGALSASAASGKRLSAQLRMSASLAGRVNSRFLPSPPFRWIYVQPKRRDVYVPEKLRVIVFSGDDRGFNMEEMLKQPVEVVDYTIDMRDWFRAIATDFITDVTLSVDIDDDQDDLEFGPDTLSEWEPVGDPAHQAKVWIAGGRDGITYQVTAIVKTDAGRVERVDFLVRVETQEQ